MPRYNYTHTVKHPVTDNELFDIDCELEISFEMDRSEPQFTVMDVYVGDETLRDGALLKALFADIISAAESDETLMERVLETEGVIAIGKGYSDPDAAYVRAA